MQMFSSLFLREYSPQNSPFGIFQEIRRCHASQRNKWTVKKLKLFDNVIKRDKLRFAMIY